MTSTSPAGDSSGDRRGDDLDDKLRRALPMASPRLLRALARGLTGPVRAGAVAANASTFDPDRSSARLQRLVDPVELMGRYRADLAEFAAAERTGGLPLSASPNSPNLRPGPPPPVQPRPPMPSPQTPSRGSVSGPPSGP
ncbi:MAG: hypothetical protein J2O49_01535, partial [Sciscionella sp.]|nr:hypothetical protein [Sciscionella sp.]